jgi:hypothetical protein
MPSDITNGRELSVPITHLLRRGFRHACAMIALNALGTVLRA